MVQLPFLISADMKQAESQEDDVSIEGMRILLAEDNELNMERKSARKKSRISVNFLRTWRTGRNSELWMFLFCTF